MVKSSEEWPIWLAAECGLHGWSHSESSPLVWRELVDTGGKGLYLGGLKEFEEYAWRYYAILPSTSPELEALIAAEDKLYYEKMQLELDEAVPEVLVKVCVTNANSSLSYHLSRLLATGAILGSSRVALHLYHQDMGEACESIAMELQDLASPQLSYVKTTTSLREAFDGVKLAFLLDWSYNAANMALCSPEGKQWKEVMGGVGCLYQDYAQAVEAWASKDVKVCVTGCVANVGVAVMAASVPALSRQCVAAPCLAENQARAVLGQQLHTNSSNISQVTIWGHTHGQVLPDHTFTRVKHFCGAVVGPDPFDLPVSLCEFKKEWLEKEFPRLVALRHQLLEGYREEGPVMAEAGAVADLARKWVLVEEGEKEDSHGTDVSDGDGPEESDGVEGEDYKMDKEKEEENRMNDSEYKLKEVQKEQDEVEEKDEDKLKSNTVEEVEEDDKEEQGDNEEEKSDGEEEMVENEDKNEEEEIEKAVVSEEEGKELKEDERRDKEKEERRIAEWRKVMLDKQKSMKKGKRTQRRGGG